MLVLVLLELIQWLASKCYCGVLSAISYIYACNGLKPLVLCLKVREELLGAVKGAEESLLQLKRARLFREVEAMADLREADGSSDPSEAADVSFQPATSPCPVDTDAATPHPFVVGGKCRFRHSDGRWYNGRIMSIDNDDVARLSFLYPTTENMQVFNSLSCLYSWLAVCMYKLLFIEVKCYLFQNLIASKFFLQIAGFESAGDKFVKFCQH